jgi:hypothetical protein
MLLISNTHSRFCDSHEVKICAKLYKIIWKCMPILIHSGNQFINRSTMHSKYSSNGHCKFNTAEYLSYAKGVPRNWLCNCNVPPNHRPVCSSISQHHCHPRAGHDLYKEPGNSRLTHSQTYTKMSQANLQLGLSGC